MEIHVHLNNGEIIHTGEYVAAEVVEKIKEDNPDDWKSYLAGIVQFYDKIFEQLKGGLDRNDSLTLKDADNNWLYIMGRHVTYVQFDGIDFFLNHLRRHSK